MDKATCTNRPITNTNNVECLSIDKTSYNLTTLNISIDNEIKQIFVTMSLLRNRIKIFAVSNFELRKVYGRTILHSDGTCPDDIKHPLHDYNIRSIRSLTLVGFFNDDFNGGIFHFPEQNLKIKLDAGSIILFPPFWTHPHEVSKFEKIENGRDFRYTINCWALDEFIPTDISSCIPSINNILIL